MPTRNGVLIQQVYKYYWWDDFKPMLDFAQPIHQAYADKWDMDYLTVVGNVREDWEAWHGGWAKVELVRQMLEKGYDYVFWVDADCLIVDDRVDLREGTPEGIGMVLHDGPGTPGPHLNVGVMLIKNSEKVRHFVKEWISRYPGNNEFPWFEQGEIHKMKNDYPGVVFQIENKWNSCTHARTHVDDAVIEGWHGMGNGAERLAQMIEYVRQKAQSGSRPTGAR